jgi:Fe-S cluster biogenesis protein NfuA
MFIQIETTPNPATLKFLPGRTVAEGREVDIRDAQAAACSPLATALLGIEGVASVFLGPDFVSVTKSAGEWQQLKPAVLGAIMEHFVSGAPVFETTATDDGPDEFFAPEDRDLVSNIKEILDARVRPAVAGDGGDITFRGYRDGVVFLAMKGACSGCPSSTATLKNGVQNLLKHYLPEIQAVEQI